MRKDSYKISVVMCTYNGEKYIYEQLKSINEQTYIPNELIICDDNSNDNTINIIKNFNSEAKLKIHLTINSVKLGLIKNFEKAIKKCNGDIIFFSDQDDVWMKNKVELIINKFKTNKNIGLIFTNALIVDDKLNNLNYTIWETIGFNKYQQFIFKKNPLKILHKKNVITGATMAIKSNYIKYLLPFNKLWIHDEWIGLIISSINKIDYLDKPLIKYRQHENQQIGGLKKNSNNIKNYVEFRKNHSFIVKKEYLKFYEMKKHLEYLFNIHVINYFPLKLFTQKCQHKNVRSNLPYNKFKRVKFIIKEIINMHYFKFSKGVLSIIKDLIYDA